MGLKAMTFSFPYICRNISQTYSRISVQFATRNSNKTELLLETTSPLHAFLKCVILIHDLDFFQKVDHNLFGPNFIPGLKLQIVTIIRYQTLQIQRSAMPGLFIFSEFTVKFFPIKLPRKFRLFLTYN